MLNKCAQALTTHWIEKCEIVKKKCKIWCMVNNTVIITKEKEISNGPYFVFYTHIWAYFLPG